MLPVKTQGMAFTVRVKLCVALGNAPLAAVNVSEYVPPVAVAGDPLSTPVLGLNVTPDGRVPAVRLTVGDGDPVAVTVNDPATPTLKVALAALVITGATDAITVSVKFWETTGSTPF
jgi:hypothetical protein